MEIEAEMVTVVTVPKFAEKQTRRRAQRMHEEGLGWKKGDV